jgi:hypothetical protein
VRHKGIERERKMLRVCIRNRGINKRKRGRQSKRKREVQREREIERESEKKRKRDR